MILHFARGLIIGANEIKYGVSIVALATVLVDRSVTVAALSGPSLRI
jgi:hypothetical protein